MPVLDSVMERLGPTWALAATPLLVGAVLSLWVAGHTLRRRHETIGQATAILNLSIALYLLGYAFELAGGSLEQVAFWLKVEYLGIANVPLLVFIVAVAWAGRARWLAPPVLAPMLGVSLTTCLLALTNERHELIWRGLKVETAGALTRTQFDRGPWYWIHNTFIYLLLIAAIAVLIRELRHRQGLFRRQAGVMLAGILLPAGVHVVYLIRPALAPVDPNPYALFLTAMALSWGVLESRLWDLVPVAREAVVASMGDAVVVIDGRGRVADVNPAARRLLAAGTGLPGRPLAEVVPELAGLVTPGDEPSRSEIELDRHGESHDFEVTVQPLIAQGRESGRVLVLRETTARKRAEAEAAEGRAQLAALVDSMMDAVIAIGEDGRVQVFNAAAERTFGIPATRMIGSSLDPLVPLRFRARHQEGIGALSHGGESRAPRVVTGLRASGQEFPAEVSLSRSDMGGHSVWTAIVRDVSEQQRAREKEVRLRQDLEAAAAEWRHTFDSMEEAMAILGAEGRVLRLNRAATEAAGMPYAESIGKPLRELGDGQPWSGAATALRNAGAGSRNAQRVLDRRTGRTWDVTVSPVEPDGGRGRFLLVARDVTDWVRLEEASRQAERLAAMGAITAGVAHEVRNPLFAISANVDVIGKILEEREDMVGPLGAVRREVARLGELMQDLLEYGRPPRLVLADAPLEGAIDAAIDACRELATGHRVDLARHDRDGSWVVPMDRARMQQVFENLIANALEYAPPGTEVSVTTEGLLKDRGRWVRCLVGDRGTGIHEEDLPRLFEPFFTRRKGGTGLGLSIVQTLVEQHGGRVQARNRAGGGAELIVELPCSG
jgi:PAS domain S-box-containing protein